MITITATRNDVARLAGTSPAVVSYVLNDGPRSVAPATRERVLAAIAKLDYRPNRLARSLRMSQTFTLGLIVPDNSNPFFAELARAVEEAAFSAGYTLLMGNATDDDQRQTTYVRTFLDRHVDGLILIPAHAPIGCRPDLERSNTPWVLLDRPIPELRSAQVAVDNKDGGWQATRHLLEHGRRSIACISGPVDTEPTFGRVAGWRAALTEAGLNPPAALMREARFGRRAGYQAMLDLIESELDFDAVFIASDEQGLGALRALIESGFGVPDDVAIASFDGIPASSYASPALTTVRQPVAELGQTAVQLLIDRVTGQSDREPEVVTLPVELVRRGSCGCADPPGGDSQLEEDIR